MSDKFKELFEEAKSSGEVPESWIDRFETSFEASGLRKDLNAVKDENKNLWSKINTMQSGLLETQFKTLGIKISPKVLNIPTDLDPTDAEKVTTWAQEMGLVEVQQTTTPSERATHDRIATASNEGGNTSGITTQDLLNAANEDEFYAKAAAYEATQKR